MSDAPRPTTTIFTDDYDRLLRVEAAARELDVERLAKALWRTYYSGSMPDAEDWTPDSFVETTAAAEAIAAEYVRLAEAQQRPGLDYGVGKSDEVRAAQAHHGEPHEFRIICRRCGEPGMIHVSVITPDERVDIRDTRLARTEDAEAQQREGAGS